MQTGTSNRPKSGEESRPKPAAPHTPAHPFHTGDEDPERRETMVRQLMAEGCDRDEAEDILRLTVW